MSTASLPNYIAHTVSRTPSHSDETLVHEQRLALGGRLLRQPSVNFIKWTKSGGVRLHLNAQKDNIILPVYGCIEGKVELSKTEGIMSVEIKVEGRLRLKEIAEGGAMSVDLCPDTILLWIKNPNNISCPSILPFNFNLPATFSHEGTIYPLPPSYNVKLNGLPGFTASIDYSICAIINKPNYQASLVKSSFFGISGGNKTVSTPFLYCPRTCPVVSIPLPLLPSRTGFVEAREWRSYESVIHSKNSGGRDITVKLYIPASRTFCISQPIPFHLTYSSSSIALAAFLPFGPSIRVVSSKIPTPTRIQLIRQSTVDVRNAIISGTKTDMWRVDSIGEGTFKHAGDGPNSCSFSGEIIINNEVKVPGFQAGGLTVKDCILLSMTPPDPTKCPFSELRHIVPVRLTTDAWVADVRPSLSDHHSETSEEQEMPHAL